MGERANREPGVQAGWRREIAGRVAVVTGAGGSIGTAVAQGLADAGANLILMGRREGPLEAVAKLVRAHGSKALVTVGAVTDPDTARRVVQCACDHFGPPTILVNCAGESGVAAPAQRISLDDWQHVLAVNLTGTFIMSTAVFPGMVQQGGGRIVNVSSIAAQMGMRNVAAYCAAKAGVDGLTRSLAAEWSRYSINVNAVAVGFVESDMNRDARQVPWFHDSVEQGTPAGRWGQPDDAARAIIFLASADAAFVTGSVLTVDGGFLHTWNPRRTNDD